jgi:hypothetical protein
MMNWQELHDYIEKMPPEELQKKVFVYNVSDASFYFADFIQFSGGLDALYIDPNREVIVE